MIHLLLLLASLSWAESPGIPETKSPGISANSPQYNSIRLDTLDLFKRQFQNGRPTITGIPTFQKGANFGQAPTISTFSSSGQLTLPNSTLFSTGSITAKDINSWGTIYQNGVPVSTNPVSVWSINGAEINNNNSGTVNVLTSLTATAIRGNPTISSATLSLVNTSAANYAISIGTSIAGIVYNGNLYVGNGMSSSNGTSGAVFLTGIQTTNNGILGGVEFTNSGSRQASIVAYNNGGATTTGLQINTSNAGSENVTPVTITGAGNVGIGTTGPGEVLEANGGIWANNGTTGTLYGNVLPANSNTQTVCYGNTSGKRSIGTCTSDERLKRSIHPLNNRSMLRSVLNLNPVEYTWKESGELAHGFIAQQVKRIIPEASKIQENGFYSLDNTAIIAHLVGAIKEQQKQIEELKKRINILEN